jgi:flagellar hook-basal body complex protein FliE
MPDFGSIDMRDITLQSGLKSLSKGISSKSNGVGEVTQSFAKVLKNSVLEVDAAQKNADIAVSELVAGDKKNVHETMISLEKADISFKLMMKVRNKILDAYKEVMRMNV